VQWINCGKVVGGDQWVGALRLDEGRDLGANQRGAATSAF